MAVGDAYVFPGILKPVTNTTFSKATEYFSQTLLQRWEAKIAGKKVRLNQGSNS